MNDHDFKPRTFWELTRRQWIRIVLPTFLNTVFVTVCIWVAMSEYHKLEVELTELKKICPR